MLDFPPPEFAQHCLTYNCYNRVDLCILVLTTMLEIDERKAVSAMVRFGPATQPFLPRYVSTQPRASSKAVILSADTSVTPLNSTGN